MTIQTDKIRENKARRKLNKSGYVLRKSRVRNTNIDNYGGYMIVDAFFNAIVSGERFNLDIDDVERFILSA